jgi:hypothetical protein
MVRRLDRRLKMAGLVKSWGTVTPSRAMSKGNESLNLFIIGFAEATELSLVAAYDEWVEFSGQWPESDRIGIESGGLKSGREQGRAFMAKYPPEERACTALGKFAQTTLPLIENPGSDRDAPKHFSQ